MTNNRHKTLIARIGSRVSGWVADMFAHPFAQIGIIVFCALWWTLKLPTDILTAALSILAITLTQMVLYNQAEREADAHRRDVAMHTKLDELIVVNRRAKNEFVGIEEREEDEIASLKEEVQHAIQKLPAGAGRHARATVERVAEEVAREVTDGDDGAVAASPKPKRDTKS